MHAANALLHHYSSFPAAAAQAHAQTEDEELLMLRLLKQ